MAVRIFILCSLLLALESLAKTDSWPPKDVDLADDPSKWPGHMEYIGTKFPEKQVEVFKGFPSVDDFLNNYVIPNRPVLLKTGASKLITLPRFDDDFLSLLPYSYSTFVEARFRANDQKKINITIRQFLKKYENEELYLDISIPMLVKSQISLPDSLKCESLLKELKRSNLLFRSGEWHDPLRSKDEQTIFCQLEGKTEFRLIDSATFRNRTLLLDNNNGTESAVNVQKVDFRKYPSLREVSHYYKVIANSTDCLFLPSKWLYQTSTDNRSVSISIAWNQKLIVPSKKTCGNPNYDNLAQFSFPEDTESNFMSFFLLGNLHRFIEDYFPQSNIKLSYQEFEKKLRKDEHLKDLSKWNDECNERAHEFFHQLDRNKDGNLSSEDFDEYSEEDLQYISGLISDRWADFQDIVTDQKEEKRNEESLLDIEKHLHGDYGKEIEDLLEESLKEIFQEANFHRKLSVGNKENTKKEKEVEEIIVEDSEDEEMKRLKELKRKINEAKQKKESTNTEGNHIHKDEL